MTYQRYMLGIAVSTAIFSVNAANMPAGATSIPAAPQIPNQLDIQLFSPEELMDFRKLEHYSEPDWVTESYVQTDKLPPVEQRLPAEPLVMKTASMPDGIGVYGGVFRQVTGARPQGWNWVAGQTQGWGGMNYAVQQCLTSTGPMYQLKPEELRPLPNLARSWEWSKDGHELTMRINPGMKWSDGTPFTTEDIRFFWEENVLNPKVPAPSSPEAIGPGATLKIVDDYTFLWHFDKPFYEQALANMGYPSFCPGPAHILKKIHPEYAKGGDYEGYNKGLPAEQTPAVTMGPWVPVEYKEDQLVVLRRNPYYWKVDESGKQLPYIDELRFKISSWEARTVEAVAGTSDFANMEEPPQFSDTLTKLVDYKSNTRSIFGPRALSYQLMLNFNKTMSVDDTREASVRELNRDIRFRKALSHALDRKGIGQALVKGPFMAEYAGGLNPASTYYNDDSVVFYPYNTDLAGKYLDELGLKDTDGDNIRNYTSGDTKGQNVEIVMLTRPEMAYATMTDNIVSMLGDVGIKVIPRVLQDSQQYAARDVGDFDWFLARGEAAWNVPGQYASFLAPINTSGPQWHTGSNSDPQVLLPFEHKLSSIVSEFLVERDKIKKTALMNEYNHVFTENLYNVGLVSYPGALLTNIRINNMPNAPLIAYQWSEDAVMRERFWVAPKRQMKQIMPNMLPEYK